MQIKNNLPKLMYIKCPLYFFLTLKTSLKNPEPIFVLWKSSIRKRVETAVFKAWQEGAEIFLERSRFKSGISNDAMATLVVPAFWPPPGSDIFRIDAEFKDSMLFNFMLDTLNFFQFFITFYKNMHLRFDKSSHSTDRHWAQAEKQKLLSGKT